MPSSSLQGSIYGGLRNKYSVMRTASLIQLALKSFNNEFESFICLIQSNNQKPFLNVHKNLFQVALTPLYVLLKALAEHLFSSYVVKALVSLMLMTTAILITLVLGDR